MRIGDGVLIPPNVCYQSHRNQYCCHHSDHREKEREKFGSLTIAVHRIMELGIMSSLDAPIIGTVTILQQEQNHEASLSNI